MLSTQSSSEEGSFWHSEYNCLGIFLKFPLPSFSSIVDPKSFRFSDRSSFFFASANVPVEVGVKATSKDCGSYTCYKKKLPKVPRIVQIYSIQVFSTATRLRLRLPPTFWIETNSAVASFDPNIGNHGNPCSSSCMQVHYEELLRGLNRQC